MGTASGNRDPARDLSQVAAEVAGCTLCPLARRRTQTVPGEGSPWTDVLLVGEGPGAREDATGRPFVGPAGELLSELLGTIGWDRSDVFITNVVKCRPPANRDPEPVEISTCARYLERQEAALEPSIVVTLGRHSLHRYLPGARVGAVRLRYRSRPLACRVEAGEGIVAGRHERLALELDAPARAGAPGQTAVLCDGDLVVGHGTIA